MLIKLLLCILLNGIDDTFEDFGISHLLEQEVDQELIEVVVQGFPLGIIELIDFSDELKA